VQGNGSKDFLLFRGGFLLGLFIGGTELHLTKALDIHWGLGLPTGRGYPHFGEEEEEVTFGGPGGHSPPPAEDSYLRRNSCLARLVGTEDLQKQLYMKSSALHTRFHFAGGAGRQEGGVPGESL